MIKESTLTAIHAEATEQDAVGEEAIWIAMDKTAEAIINKVEAEADHYDALEMPDKAVALRNLAAELRKDFA